MDIDSLLQWLQAIALVAAAAFFAAKLATGVFIVNLTLDPELSRHRLGNGQDVIIVRCGLRRGKSGGALKLQRATILHTTEEGLGDWKMTALAPTNRRDLSAGPDAHPVPEGTRTPTRQLKMPVDESTVLSGSFTVDAESVCTVQIIVEGLFLRPGQWGASLVSAPLGGDGADRG